MDFRYSQNSEENVDKIIQKKLEREIFNYLSTQKKCTRAGGAFSSLILQNYL
jgi:hypothetical protein